MAVNLGDSFEKKKTITYVYGVQTAYGGALGGLDINIEPPFDWSDLEQSLSYIALNLEGSHSHEFRDCHIEANPLNRKYLLRTKEGEPVVLTLQWPHGRLPSRKVVIKVEHFAASKEALESLEAMIKSCERFKEGSKREYLFKKLEEEGPGSFLY